MLPESQKENKINISEKKPKVNMFFLVLSGRFKTAKYIALCVLVVFLLTMIVLFRSEITVENLRYLLKDFEAGENITAIGDGVITYDSDLQVSLTMYKGDLVIAGSSYFYLCDLSGNKRFSEDSIFSNPITLSSDKYLLVYGLSEYTYAIYNTFSQLHTETFDYPITSATISNNGYYAIVSRTAEYRSAVYLYNDSFDRIGAVYKDKYVMDVEFNSSGTELLITSMYSENGNYCTEIVNYVPFSEQPSSSVKVENSMPLVTGYNKEGGYSVVYDNKIEFYDSEFILYNKYEFGSKIVPVTTEITDSYTVITYNENIVGDNIKVLVFDINGNLILDTKANGHPQKTKTYNDYVYILLDGKICKMSINNGSLVYYVTEKNALELIVINDKSVLVCYSDHVSKISTE